MELLIPNLNPALINCAFTEKKGRRRSKDKNQKEFFIDIDLIERKQKVLHQFTDG
jgi:hypothetical protein